VIDTYKSFMKRHGLKSDPALEKAFIMAEKAHEGQFRHSGEPYVSHPLAVAEILADLGMDTDTIIAGLLHDVIEDTDLTMEVIQKEFSPQISALVDGVTKLKNLEFKSYEEQQAESLRKMLLAMAADIRVIIIKLADRLHNMRTLKYQSENKQIEKAKETLEIYAPLAHRLGISTIKWELEDLSLKYLNPDEYFEIAHKIEGTRTERETHLKEVMEKIREKLKELKIKCDIDGRPKHIYSIYKKMHDKNKIFEEVYDLIAIRIIVKSVKDCYGVLGLVHTMWKPIPMRFKDYIAVPKQNMYQSLHTTLLGDDGKPFEVQIRTYEMHRTAEYGIAAHWKYKEENKKNDEDMDTRLAWLREILEWQNDLKDSKEFMETLKIDIFSDNVFVFTPKGDVRDFIKGSTPLDFAYNVHSEVGNKCVGAKINGKIVPLDYKLKTGDIVEIITSQTSKGPSRDWLKVVKTAQARSKIKQWFKKEYKEENIQKGKEMLEKEAKRQGYELRDLMDSNILKTIFKRFTLKSQNDMYAAIGYGGLTTNQILFRLIQNYKLINKMAQEGIDNTVNVKSVSKASQEGVIVKGQSGMVVRFAKCCNPVFGDEIVGYVTRGRGVSVHRKDCRALKNEDFESERMIAVEWVGNEKASYNVEIQIIADDRSGLIADVTKSLFNLGRDITAINAKTGKYSHASISLRVNISSVEELNETIERLKLLDGVEKVYRVNY
jgi:guanosine-3',5'-bis(diphosphate) 3'-pyrophosphohydrolase